MHSSETKSPNPTNLTLLIKSKTTHYNMDRTAVSTVARSCSSNSWITNPDAEPDSLSGMEKEKICLRACVELANMRMPGGNREGDRCYMGFIRAIRLWHGSSVILAAAVQCAHAIKAKSTLCNYFKAKLSPINQLFLR